MVSLYIMTKCCKKCTQGSEDKSCLYYSA